MELWQHKSSGHWCKTIKGKRHHFGKDKDAALEEWYRVKDALLAGRARPAKGGFELADACNYLLTRKRQKVEAGELSHVHWEDIKTMCEYVIDHWGRHRTLESIGPDDFGELRAKMMKRWAPGGMKQRMHNIKLIFNFAWKNGKLREQVRWGDQFSVPSQKVVRKAAEKRGPKLFTAEEIRTLLDRATPHMRAFILLGVNCGMGNKDIAMLERRHIQDGWMTKPREKNGTPRRAKLWPETIAAIEEARANQPTTKGEWKDLLFLSPYRNPWSDPNSRNCSMSNIFRRLAQEAEVWKRNAKTFYALRHVFATVAGESRDQVAVDYVMGHCDGSIASVYRESVSDERLEAVSSVVHDWLFPPRP